MVAFSALQIQASEVSSRLNAKKSLMRVSDGGVSQAFAQVELCIRIGVRGERHKACFSS
jgi:hypothetical protein